MKKRVLHIITRLDPGGSTTNTLETVARLDTSKYEAHLVAGATADPSGKAAAFMRDRGIACTFVDELVREVDPGPDIKAFFALRSIIQKGAYDIVHTHSSKAGILGRWAAKSVGVKHIVHTPHGHVFYGYFSPLKTKVFITIERLTAYVTDRLVALTAAGVREHLEFKVGREKQWVTIPSGINLAEFKENASARMRIRREFGFQDHECVIICVARLEPVKGLGTLIEAVGILRSEGVHVRLLLAGGGGEEMALKALVFEKGLMDRVVFAGHRDDASDILNGADIFALASRNEGMGRAVIEAMACGKPVVVSRTGGLPEIVTDGVEGFCVEPGDALAFANALGMVVKDTALRGRMSEAAQRRATGEFSVETMVRKIECLYDGLIQGLPEGL
ncbi:MAG: glycosyltransferase family 4 protein [Candidatus Omnitrophica bacterium]|nr:glycosyltransferase family 4 protein [Candidatus Omnitrophota bacterium]